MIDYWRLTVFLSVVQNRVVSVVRCLSLVVLVFQVVG